MEDEKLRDEANVEPRRPVLISGGQSFMQEKLRGKTFLIPSFITVIGNFCGFLAIISALRGNFDYAAKCIGLAVILDGLDGRVARRLNATSAFGREFDSLSDQVAFGVAPAVLVYMWAFQNLADEFGILVAFVFVACGATRLARFNISTTTEVKSTFTGLPIPGAAGALAAVVYCFSYPITNPGVVILLMIYMLALSFFMVSTIPYLSLKKLKLTQGNPRLNVTVLAVLVALAWKYSYEVILVGANLYAFSGGAMYLWNTAFGSRAKKKTDSFAA